MFLKVNFSKFDLIYFREPSRLIESCSSTDISINLSLAPSSPIHSLALTFDSFLSLIPQIKSVAKSSFFHLRRIKQLKLFLDNPTLKLLVSSLILSRFDYCNSLCYELPETMLHLLPKAFYSSSRLVFGIKILAYNSCSPHRLSLNKEPISSLALSCLKK